MKRSADRILTTHTGSLARPPELFQLLDARRQGKPVDAAAFEAACRKAVHDVVRQQADAGISIISDGEQSKSSFSTYVKQRLSGFGDEEIAMPLSLDARDFPRWKFEIKLAPCIGPVNWKDFGAVEKDIDNLTAASQEVQVDEVFMTAVSPGSLANFFPNRHYAGREEYLAALADVMSREYRAIADAGFVLQLDCPDLALRNYWFPDLSMEEFRGVVAQNIEVLNHAISDIPASQVRMHVCWGAGESPSNHDVPLEAIVDLLLGANVGALSIVGANGRHEHEWKVWQRVPLPDEMVLIPGVIDNTTNIIEHPEVVADRIVRYAGEVGRERVIAGVDCGFGTGASANPAVDPLIAMAKLRALHDGAEIASNQLWA